MSLNVELLKKSFSAIRPHAQEVVSHFYDTLFAKYPQAKPLFEKIDMNRQKLALANGLAHIVDYLEEQDHLVDYLKKMGARHVKYGVKNEHYPWVADALLSTFEYYFDEHWTPELKKAWTDALNVVASVMMDGMKSAQPVQTTPSALIHHAPAAGTKAEQDLSEMARSFAKDFLRKTLEEQIDDTLMQMAREKMRALLKQALKEEIKELFKSYHHDHKNAA